jgi:hypothetical protein
VVPGGERLEPRPQRLRVGLRGSVAHGSSISRRGPVGSRGRRAEEDLGDAELPGFEPGLHGLARASAPGRPPGLRFGMGGPGHGGR